MAWKYTLQPDSSDKPTTGGSTRLPIYPAFSNTNSQAYRLRRLEIGAQRQRGGQIQMTVGQYTRAPINVLDTANQKIDLTLSTVRKVGSLSPAGNTSGFAYTSTANSITWYWDGTNGSTVIVLNRADGSKQVIPTAGSGLTVSGLANTTTYYFLPYWTPNQGCNVSWVFGTIGTPQIAFVLADTTSVATGNLYLLQQSLQAREQLTGGWMSATTGSSGGGGGGGSGGHCVMSGTDIQPVGGLDYMIEVLGETQWMRIVADDGRFLHCTLNHPLYHETGGKMQAELFKVGDGIITDHGIRYVEAMDQFQRKCSKYKVMMPKGHLYYANGFLSHNLKPVPPP
jgi:hypothetical protein